ncbi:hypothetical protein HII13_003622 [Brettanomyces bruxellensis]|uniref:Uncharacterized protein n=1 Tax=Dekkera bruxellensis TaxID=5007 RepID=A0A8H6ET79_DEKBR|nr:uncharacterized protein BRETT_003803 [Brettanomyces bruxellensis]KAF6009277.1 hypothetical protein HII13_003622 [Brettanomyces bruxellensis]QOU19652.1 hypothetical protein BRETT_003803 [Brettanomyces bruxellensis]
MDPAEEQKQEIEILKTIYPEELEILSDTEFTINLLLDVESERKHAVKLHIRYPATYPEVVPELWVVAGDTNADDEKNAEVEKEIEEEEEDTDLKDSQRALNLIETIELDKKDIGELSDKLDEEAKMNIGMPSVFTLASVLKDDAEQMFNKKLEAETQKLEQARVSREKQEQKKFIGTKVTRENFEAWQVKFRKEMGIKERKEKRFEEIHQGKLTGKEIFERGLAGEEGGEPQVAADDIAGMESVTEGVKNTSI